MQSWSDIIEHALKEVTKYGRTYLIPPGDLEAAKPVEFGDEPAIAALDRMLLPLGLQAKLDKDGLVHVTRLPAGP
jgi:hypothetical protein